MLLTPYQQVGLLVNDFVTDSEAKIVCMGKVHATLHNKTVLPDKTSEISILVDEVLAQVPQTYIQPMYLDTTRTLLIRLLQTVMFFLPLVQTVMQRA